MNNTSEHETIIHAVSPDSAVESLRSRESNFSVSDAIKAK